MLFQLRQNLSRAITWPLVVFSFYSGCFKHKLTELIQLVGAQKRQCSPGKESTF
jgi:hypothetical protein